MIPSFAARVTPTLVTPLCSGWVVLHLCVSLVGWLACVNKTDPLPSLVSGISSLIQKETYCTVAHRIMFRCSVLRVSELNSR